MKQVSIILFLGWAFAFAQSMQIIKTTDQTNLLPIHTQTKITFNDESMIYWDYDALLLTLYDDIQKIVFAASTVGFENPTNPKDANSVYVNPQLKRVSIEFKLVKSGLVSMDVYNSLGENIKTLLNANRAAGDYSVFWDGTNQAGQYVSKGTYYVRIELAGDLVNKKIVMVN